MKRIITILLLGFCLTSFAQDKRFVLKADELIDPDLKMLYIGIDNPIIIENNNDTNIFLTMDEGFCRRWKENDSLLYYIARPESGSKNATIKILKKTQSDTLLLDSVNFTVLRIPDPIPLFGNLADTEATVNILMLQNEIKTFMPCYFKLLFRISSFTLSSVKLDGSIERVSSSSNIITEVQKQMINNLKPGDLIYIEDITCRNRDGCARLLIPIKIRVKLR